MVACTTEYREVVRHESNLYLSGHILLYAVHHGLHVPAYRIEIHGLMHLLTVPSGNLLLPIELTLCESMLLKKVMSLHDDKRSRCLETYTTLDTDDGVTDMYVATDSERTCNITDCLDHIYRTHLYAVE